MIYFPYFCLNNKLIVWKMKISSYCKGCSYSNLFRTARGEGKLLRRLALRDEI